jgi:cobalamin biosynthesis Mg chelatase CobN
MYEDLENELQALDEEDKDKLMSLNGSNIDEYKEFKKDSEARKKELREKIIKENEREKVLNELLKRDEEYFEQKKLEKIREQLLSEIKPPKENNETN